MEHAGQPRELAETVSATSGSPAYFFKMNKYQAILTWGNPVTTLRKDDSIAITTMDHSITYKHFNSRIKYLAQQLTNCNLNNKHRVLIVGDNTKIIESICWTWAAMYLGASPGNASISESDEDIKLKAGAGNCDAIIYVDGTIDLKIGFDFNKTSKVHSSERYILYSSGTTKKKHEKYGAEPQFFRYYKGWKGGIAHIDQLNLAARFLGEVPINEIACHGWEVAYAPHNVIQCLLTGGTYHWVDSPNLMPRAQATYKTNLMSNYPLSYDPICEAWQNCSGVPPIEFVEVAGGICTSELIRKIRETIKPRVISNSYISSASGTILNRTIDATDDPEECVWMENPHLDPTLRLRMDDSNVLWFKRHDSKWITDGDVFEQVGKYYRVIGKSSEEYIQTEFAKISTWEIEQFANQLTRTVWGCGEHTYCFAINGLPGGVKHGLVYSGPLDIKLMKERMDQLEEYKRPYLIYRVKSEFWSLNIKVSRDYMEERLYKNSEYIEDLSL